ncbi:MAG: hypothetical protein ACFCD0_15150 [Gemmataceae bacterium]
MTSGHGNAGRLGCFLEQQVESEKSNKGSKVPWGFLFSALILFGITLWQYQPFPLYVPSAWELCGPVLACGLALCLMSRGILHPFWCLVVGLLFLFHPMFSEPGTAALQSGLVVETGLTLGMAVLFGMWHVGRAPQPQILSLLGLWAVTMLIGGWVWLWHPYGGLILTSLASVGLMLCSGIFWIGTNRAKQKPATVNAVIIGVLGAASVVVPFLLANAGNKIVEMKALGGFDLSSILPKSHLPHGFGPMLEASVTPSSAGFTAGWSGDERDVWMWGNFWVVVGLMAWGVWRSIARTWTQVAGGQQPMAALSVLFVVSHVLGCWLQPSAMKLLNFVPLATLSVFLSVYGVGDLFHGLTEKLTLHPPDETERPTRFSVDQKASQPKASEQTAMTQPEAEDHPGSTANS